MHEFPPFRLDVENQCLWRGEERITLTPKAFHVLHYLVERAGRLVTQSEILEALWPDTFVQPEVLKSHILDIRTALGDDARNPLFIETQPRRGYRFIAKIREATQAGPTATAAPEAITIAPTPSIAVLPFADLSGDKDSQYFGAGLAEDIINALSQISGLKVIARTSAFAVNGQNQDIRRIAEALGVAHILEGSVRKAGNHVRITAQLIAASDGSHLWSGRYDREMTDIFAIQDEISQAIVEALEAKLGAPVLRPERSQRSAAPAAYEAYLEGRYYMQQVTPQGMERALECYQRAIRLDPGYALPYVGMAQRVHYQALYLAGRPREIVPDALASLGRALQLDPEAAEAHLVRAVFSILFEYNWNAAREHYAHALELDPVSPRIRASRACWFLAPLGRLDEALADARRAVNLDPLNPSFRNIEAWVLHLMRRPEAVERARGALQLFPSYWITSFIGSLVFLHAGLPDEAVAALEKGLEIVPGSTYLLGALARVRGREGRVEEAQGIRAELESRAARQYTPFLPRALASEGCGDMDCAYQLLDQAIDEREPLAIGILHDRRSDLQSDPRYQCLLRRMNLT